MIKKVIHLFMFFIIVAFISSCISDIEFDTIDGSESILAIQGSLVKGSPHVFTARIQSVAGFASSVSGVIARTVTLSNDLGQEIDVPRISTIFYRLEIPQDSEEFIVEDFMSFKLTVVSTDNRTFESTMEQLLPVPEVEEISFSLVERQELGAVGQLVPVTKIAINITTPTTIPGTQDNVSLRWTFEEVFTVTDIPILDRIEPKTCYITQSLGATVEQVINPDEIGIQRLQEFNVFDHNITSNHAEENFFVALQQSLTPTAFNYFNLVSELINREASIFTAPAGQIPSNFTNIEDPNDQVFGYFYATSIDTARVFISAESVGITSPRCPVVSMRPVQCPDAICCDCLDTENSTLEKPSFW